MSGTSNGPKNEGTGRIFDEFAKLITDAAGVAQGAKRDVESAFKGQAERMLDHLDVVQRDEFEAVKEMAARARTEASELKLEVDGLKKQLAELSNSKPKPNLKPNLKPKAKTAKPATRKAAPKAAAKSAPKK